MTINNTVPLDCGCEEFDSFAYVADAYFRTSSTRGGVCSPIGSRDDLYWAVFWRACEDDDVFVGNSCRVSLTHRQDVDDPWACEGKTNTLCSKLDVSVTPWVDGVFDYEQAQHINKNDLFVSIWLFCSSLTVHHLCSACQFQTINPKVKARNITLRHHLQQKWVSCAKSYSCICWIYVHIRIKIFREYWLWHAQELMPYIANRYVCTHVLVKVVHVFPLICVGIILHHSWLSVFMHSER